MYEGKVIDTFLHTPWLGGSDPDNPRGDIVDWNGDARLQRVMRTFHHTDPHGVQVNPKTREEILGEMDRARVEGAVLAAKVYYPSSERGVDALHLELAKLAEGCEERLKVVATIVPPQHGPNTYWDVLQNVRLLERAVERHRVIGVHLTPAPWGIDPTDKFFYPLYAKCVELDLCLYVYVGMPGALWPMRHNDPTHLDEVALAFPDLKIIAHHIGDPWNDMVVRLAARHKNYFVCTSAWHPKTYPSELIAFMAGKWHGTWGSEKVVFASDWPILDMTKAVSAARALPLADEQLTSFLYTNAKRLFFA
jgi:hypothetical protein